MTFKKQKQTFKKNSKRKYKQAVEHWGKDAQINMLVEEASELAEAAARLIKRIMKVNRASTKKGVNMAILLLEAEIADVEIMCEQMHYIFDGENINKIKREKIKRIERMLRK
jgi:hypothetical protein